MCSGRRSCKAMCPRVGVRCRRTIISYPANVAGRTRGALYSHKPRLRPFPQGELVERHKRALLLVLQRFGELVGDLLTRLAVERRTLGLPGRWIAANRDLCHPAPIGAPGNGPFIVPAFLRHRVLSPLS